MSSNMTSLSLYPVSLLSWTAIVVEDGKCWEKNVLGRKKVMEGGKCWEEKTVGRKKLLGGRSVERKNVLGGRKCWEEGIVDRK